MAAKYRKSEETFGSQHSGASKFDLKFTKESVRIMLDSCLSQVNLIFVVLATER